MGGRTNVIRSSRDRLWTRGIRRLLEQTDDGGITVYDWMDYAGRLIEKRQANKKRMRSARAKHVQRTCTA